MIWSSSQSSVELRRETGWAERTSGHEYPGSALKPTLERPASLPQHRRKIRRDSRCRLDSNGSERPWRRLVTSGGFIAIVRSLHRLDFKEQHTCHYTYDTVWAASLKRDRRDIRLFFRGPGLSQSVFVGLLGLLDVRRGGSDNRRALLQTGFPTSIPALRRARIDARESVASTCPTRSVPVAGVVSTEKLTLLADRPFADCTVLEVHEFHVTALVLLLSCKEDSFVACGSSRSTTKE